ncbi:hypothetical protein NXX23_18135 [Bacteroides ovatus]|nr:hypothetical protein [Bacteroides ovatus]
MHSNRADLPYYVRLLGLIVPVIAENQCRHALPQHVGQRTEGAEIFGFYRL